MHFQIINVKLRQDGQLRRKSKVGESLKMMSMSYVVASLPLTSFRIMREGGGKRKLSESKVK